MDRLRDKIRELRKHFDSALSGMLKVKEAHLLPWQIARLHAKLHELSREVERVIRESFKDQT